MRIKVFQTSDGRLFSIDMEVEEAKVREHLSVGTTGVFTTRMLVDTWAGARYWREDNPERWCRTLPHDHPELPQLMEANQ